MRLELGLLGLVCLGVLGQQGRLMLWAWRRPLQTGPHANGPGLGVEEGGEAAELCLCLEEGLCLELVLLSLVRLGVLGQQGLLLWVWRRSLLIGPHASGPGLGVEKGREAAGGHLGADAGSRGIAGALGGLPAPPLPPLEDDLLAFLLAFLPPLPPDLEEPEPLLPPLERGGYCGGAGARVGVKAMWAVDGAEERLAMLSSFRRRSFQTCKEGNIWL